MQNIPTPKARMKKLQWNPIHPNKVVGKKNFWNDVCEKFESEDDKFDLDFSKVEVLFSVPDSSMTKRPAGDATSQNDKKTKKEEVSKKCPCSIS